jgi:hypothetical protein
MIRKSDLLVNHARVCSLSLDGDLVSPMCTVGTCPPQPATVEGEKEAIYHCVSSEQILL